MPDTATPEIQATAADLSPVSPSPVHTVAPVILPALQDTADVLDAMTEMPSIQEIKDAGMSLVPNADPGLPPDVVSNNQNDNDSELDSLDEAYNGEEGDETSNIQQEEQEKADVVEDDYLKSFDSPVQDELDSSAEHHHVSQAAESHTNHLSYDPSQSAQVVPDVDSSTAQQPPTTQSAPQPTADQTSSGHPESANGDAQTIDISRLVAEMTAQADEYPSQQPPLSTTQPKPVQDMPPSASSSLPPKPPVTDGVSPALTNPDDIHLLHQPHGVPPQSSHYAGAGAQGNFADIAHFQPTLAPTSTNPPPYLEMAGFNTEQANEDTDPNSLWEAFNADERKYMAEARWDKFPEGSRIFIEDAQGAMQHLQGTEVKGRKIQEAAVERETRDRGEPMVLAIDEDATTAAKVAPPHRGWAEMMGTVVIEATRSRITRLAVVLARRPVMYDPTTPTVAVAKARRPATAVEVKTTHMTTACRCHDGTVVKFQIMPRDAVIQRQVVEGVHAVVDLDIRANTTGRFSLRVFDRSSNGNTRFDEYRELEPHVAAELVVRARAHAPPPPSYHAPPPGPAYGGGSYDQHYPSQQQPQAVPRAPAYASHPSHHQAPPGPPPHATPAAGGLPPDLLTSLGHLDGATLQQLVAAVQNQQGGGPGPAVQGGGMPGSAPQQANGQLDVQAVLNNLRGRPAAAGEPAPSYGGGGYPPSGPGDFNGPNGPSGRPHAPASPESASQVNTIMAQLAKFRQ
ncbi:hypothetical protein ACHAQH_002099 [Verticillium albo-atrum]